jgi:hypothetical protein
MWRYVLGLAMLSGPVGAEVLRAAVPAQVVASGGHCDRIPDETIPAPDAGGGSYDHNFSAFVYVVSGDSVPNEPGLGIGVRVRLEGFLPGEPIRVRIDPPDGDEAGSWNMAVGPDGEIEFGRLPAYGEALPVGQYRLSVSQGGRWVFSYAIRVVTAEVQGLCIPEVS